MFGAGNNNPSWGSGNPTFGGGTTTAPSVFGAATTTAPSIFGAGSTTAPSVFGAGSTTTPSVFGAGTAPTPGVFGATVTAPSVFGAGTSTTHNVFGAATTTAPSAFGARTTTAPNVFGAGTGTAPSVFGAGTGTAPSVFGAGTATAPSVFGAGTTTAPSVFGAGTTQAFGGQGTGASGFGSTTSAAMTNVPGSFGAPSSAPFGRGGGASTTTVSSNPFSKPASTTSSTFGTSSQQPTNVFGNVSKPFSSAPPSNVFGAGSSNPSFGQGTGSSMGTESSAAASVFGGSKVFGAGSTQETSFGGPPKTTVGATSVFGTTTASPAFGAPTVTATGGVPGAVRSVAFGESSTKPAPPSGIVFGRTNPPTSTPTFGAPAAATAPFGGPAVTTSSVFGSRMPPTTASSTSVPANTAFGQTARSIVEKAVSASTASQGLFGKTANFAGTAPKSRFGKRSTSDTAANPVGKPATDDTDKNLFGTNTSATNEPTKALFGKPSATMSTGETSSGASVPPLFGKPADKQESSTGLFGKRESTKDAARPEGRSVLQRLGTAKDADVKKKATTGLFGRAIANVAEEKDKPRGARRMVTTERSKESSERPKRSPPTEARALPRRRATVDDLSQFTVLIAKNVPPSVNNKVAIRKHFSRFGKVSKVYPTPAKSMVTVHFEDHESALNAKKNGLIVRQGLPKLSLFWKALAAKATTSPTTETSPTLQTSQEAGPSRASHVPKNLFSGPKEVNAELASMSGADDDTFGTEMKVLERPDGLQTDRLAGALAQPLSRNSRSPDRKRDRPSSSERPMRGSRREKARSVSPVGRIGRAPKEPVEMPKVKVVPREDSASPVPTTAPIVSVRSLIGKRCMTDQERVDVLEARDKLLREARGVLNKGKDLATASAIKGTCMDMCPEKERYLRQERRRLTMYEIHPQSDGRGLVDHARAVKEYSRSSADQDMPLANELRPPHVLDRTLSYILNNIIGLGDDGKWSDWYEYIWSRTRGIRKDITQQQLCDQTAVALVERCARFHIFCAERLCEEDAAVFDQKINDENLTKCLQTLKELYHDLAVKHGQHCQHEAEFRAYVVLMNLNEGDTLRETQQLRPEIREAPPVKFALSVYSALNSNNYIRFFKLVRQSSFLNACIMHRYFNQVRSSALLTMCMAYSVPGKTALVPISDLVRLLGFEDDEGVVSVCEHHGLPTENDCISMMRNNYMEPESAMAMRRARTLIESKLTTSAGEAIHGSPLPPNEILTPMSSFDSEGCFCPDAATLQVVQEQEGDEDAPPPPQPPVRSASPAPQSPAKTEVDAEPATARHPYSNDAVKAAAKEIFIEVIEEICQEMSQNLVQTCHFFLNTAAPLTEQFIDEHIPQLTRQISEEVVQEERNRVEQEARARAEKSIRRERIAEQLRSDMTEETLQQIVLELAQEETQAVDRQLRQESQQRCSITYMDNLLYEVLTAETERLTADFYAQEVEQKRWALAQAEEATHILRQRRHFRRWKNKLAGRQRLKRSMLDFPAAPSMYSPSERLQHILPESTGLSESRNAVHLGHNAWLTLTPPNVVVEKENELIQEILRQNEEARQKLVLCRSSIDVCRVVGPLLVKKLSHSNRRKTVKGNIERVYWKLLLSLPQAETTDEEDYHDWVINKLSTADDNFPPEIYNRLAEVIGRSCHTETGVDGQPVSVHAAVRYMSGIMGDAELYQLQRGVHLQATNTILFLVGHRAVSNIQTWQMERRRLHQVLSLYNTTKLALIIVAPPGMVGESRLKLADLCKDVFFSRVVALADDVINPATTLQVQTALEELARHCPPQDPLRAEWMTDYLEHGLQRFFYSKLQNSVFSNSPEHNLNQVASEMVELYNTAVEHLATVAGEPGLQDVSWPPIEFCHTNNDLPMPKWNSERSLHYLSQLISTLTLPPYEDDVHGDDCWADACAAVWQYVRLVAADTQGTDVFLVSRIRNLLQQAQELFEDQCLWTTGVAEAEPSGSDIPWGRIIRLCIDHKMACINTLVPDANQNSLDYDELRVFYEPDQMDSFRVPDEWLSVCRQSAGRSVLETSIRRAVKRKQDKLTSMTPEASAKKKSTRYTLTEVNCTKLDLEPTDPKLLEAQTQAVELLGDLAAEKKAVSDYEKYLEDLLKEGDLTLPPVPHIHHSLSTSGF